jgi:hypothetical protein
VGRPLIAGGGVPHDECNDCFFLLLLWKLMMMMMMMVVLLTKEEQKGAGTRML